MELFQQVILQKHFEAFCSEIFSLRNFFFSLGLLQKDFTVSWISEGLNFEKSRRIVSAKF